MGALEDDLKKYANETVTAEDAWNGIKALANIGIEVAGFIAVVAALSAATGLVLSWLPPLGLGFMAGGIKVLYVRAAKAYTKLDAMDRRHVRKLIRYINPFLPN